MTEWRYKKAAAHSSRHYGAFKKKSLSNSVHPMVTIMKQRALTSRRHLVKLAISAISLSWGVWSATAAVNFLGIAAGDATSDEAVIWTRAVDSVAPSPLALIAQVAPNDPTLTVGVTTVNLMTDTARDYT